MSDKIETLTLDQITARIAEIKGHLDQAPPVMTLMECAVYVKLEAEFYDLYAEKEARMNAGLPFPPRYAEHGSVLCVL